jgi:hypothetical protein
MTMLNSAGLKLVTVQYVDVTCLITKSDIFHNNDTLLTYLQKGGKTNTNATYNKIQAVLICSITYFLVISLGHHLQHTITCKKH